MDLGKAYVQIVPSAEGISGSISKVMDGEASNAGSSAGQKFSGGLAKSLKVGGAAMAGLSAAAVGLGKSLYDNATKTAAAGDEIDKMSQKIGISAESYQEWSYVMELCGTDVNNLQSGMKTLSDVIVEASNGSETAAEKLAAVGLSVEDLNGLSQDDQLNLVIGRLQEMESGAERTSAATDLLGKSATDMAALLNQSTEATEEMKQAAHDYGLVMSDEAVANSAAFNDSLTTLKGSVGGVVNGLMSDMLPSLTSIMEGFTGVITGSKGASDTLKEGFSSLVSNVSEALPGIMTTITSVVEALAENAPEIIAALVKGIIENLPKLLKAAVKIVLAIGKGIVDSVGELGKDLGKFIGELVKKLGEFGSKMAEAGKELISGLWNGIKEKWTGLVDNVKELGSSLISSVKSIFGIHSPSKVFAEIGEYCGEGLAEGLESMPEALSDTEDELQKQLKNGFDFEASASLKMPLPTASQIRTAPQQNPADLAAAITTAMKSVGIDARIQLEPNTAKFFSSMRAEATAYRKRTGSEAFA